MRDACGDADVDVVLTTREIVRMFRGEQINPAVLDETPFDSPLGSGTGAAVIFGATGGVMDAALRSAYYLVTGKNPDPDAFRDIRGMDGWKEAKFEIPGAGVVSVAVASGLLNTRKLMTALERGEVRYDFVEIMACPGGCAGGGGQLSMTAWSWRKNAAASCGASIRPPPAGSPMRTLTCGSCTAIT